MEFGMKVGFVLVAEVVSGVWGWGGGEGGGSQHLQSTGVVEPLKMFTKKSQSNVLYIYLIRIKNRILKKVKIIKR